MATKKCANGHLYDPAIYGDKCPFCSGEHMCGYVEGMMPPVYISAENLNSASKLIYEVVGMSWHYSIEVTANIIVAKIWARGKDETEYSFSNESVSFNALKQWLSEQNIYKQWQILNGGAITCGAFEYLGIIKQDKSVFRAQWNRNRGGDLHCKCNLSMVFMKLLPNYVIQGIKTIY